LKASRGVAMEQLIPVLDALLAEGADRGPA
jgi:hypothetical protein